MTVDRAAAIVQAWADADAAINRLGEMLPKSTDPEDEDLAHRVIAEFTVRNRDAGQVGDNFLVDAADIRSGLERAVSPGFM